MISKFAEHYGVDKKIVALSLEKAIRESVLGFIRYYDCDVNSQKKNLTLYFRVPEDMSLEDALIVNQDAVSNDIVSINFEYDSLPDALINKCKDIFPGILADVHALNQFRMWIKKRKQAVEGVILGKNINFIEVELGNQIGILEKSEWIPKEASRYREGLPFNFLVTRVKKNKASVVVYLSRRSINLPCAILKQKMPWNRFKPVWRRAGYKSIIKTDCKINDTILQTVKTEVENELNEIIIFQS